MEFNWTTFTKRINIAASVEAIYQMWATKDGMEKWFLRRCDYTDGNGAPLPGAILVQKGHLYTWYWYGWPDETNEKGHILDANGVDTLSFTFGQQGADGMTCTVSIFAEAAATICELVQANIPVDEKGKASYHLGCSTGWTFYMTNLKSILEGGIDLRNKNVDLKNVLNS
jgi:uncharacterized protein YndB with AHSA1/START domain